MNTSKHPIILVWMLAVPIAFVPLITSCHTENNDKRGGFSNYLPSFSRANDSKTADTVASDLGLNSSSVAGAVACDQQNGVLSIYLAKVDPAGRTYRPTLGPDIKVAFSISGAIDPSKCTRPSPHEMQCPGLGTGQTVSVAATVTLPRGESGDTPVTKCTGN